MMKLSRNTWLLNLKNKKRLMRTLSRIYTIWKMLIANLRVTLKQYL